MPATTTATNESETLTAAELAAILSKRAESDMRCARKYGPLMITKTKIGNIELTWSAEAGYVAYHRAGAYGPGNGKAYVKAFLVSNYVVITA